MLIRKKLPRSHGLNEPILHASHRRPVTRRELLASGLMTGPAVIAASGLLGLLANPRRAMAALTDTEALLAPCGVEALGPDRKIPFICFDLAGGANLNGSEALIGGSGGQKDFLSTAGYARLGLPGDMVPNAPNAASPTGNFINEEFGLAWHSDGAMLLGMLESTSVATRAGTNGCVIAARSENDTANNPHNPMYGILRAGAKGELLTLIGSQASDSGGNSMAPASMIDLSNRPTKVDRASDVTGLVDTGELAKMLPNGNATKVLESMVRLTGGLTGAIDVDAFGGKLAKLTMGMNEAAIKHAVRCAYVKSAYLADKFADPGALNPNLDPLIVDQDGTRTGIFTRAQYDGDGEFRKTAAVMKMVIEGYAAAGTITMGGYDYHDGTRATGELRNFRAGRCIGACLEYAARKGKPVMIYVFSDGSLNATNTIDNSVNGRGKFGWQGDNQSVANSFFLVYSPNGRPMPRVADPAGGVGKQIGYYRDDGSVETSSFPGANAVNLLVQTVVLNWMGLHGEEGQFNAPDRFPTHGLGADYTKYVAFNPIV